jgi:hypothetical protein
MKSIDESHDLIREHEEKFARRLADKIIAKPHLSVWMILIPIIFVYYFLQKDKYVTGCREFVKHYMVSRNRALDAARAASSGMCQPEIAPLVAIAKIPHPARKAYQDFLEVLIDHFQVLLVQKGDSFEELIRGAYSSKTDYLLYLSQLHRAERELDRALTLVMAESTEGCGEAAARIEKSLEELRRKEADTFFP